MVKMWEEIHEQSNAIQRCMETNNKIIKKIIEKIRRNGVNFVCIAARGTSDHAGVYGKYVIELTTGTPVALAASSIITMYNGNLNLSNSLVIGISQSGKAADVIEVVKNAKKHNALTVSITNDCQSPLAKESDYHLFCNAGPERSVAATKTFTTQMFLLAQLAAEWSCDRNIINELKTLPKKIEQSFMIAGKIKEKARRYCFMNECFVLARGINYSIALEAALKIQETTYIRAKAFATSDFQHGPIAMLDKEIPVMVFAPDGPSLDDLINMIETLEDKKIELIIISNNNDILDKGQSAFEIPKTSNDIISPFFNVIAAQMFACELALAKGLDPDNPRMLKKVTVTK